MKNFYGIFLLLLLSFCAAAQAPGDQFFGAWEVHDIRFYFSQPGYWDSLKANYLTDVYMRCDVRIDGLLYPVSGVKYKGNSSYNNPSRKKPFRIDLAEYTGNQTHDGLKKLMLNNAFKDPSFLREKLMLDFLRAHNIAAPRATFARLYVNDHYWGLYSVVEDVNKTFLDSRFGNKKGNLFKGDPKGTLAWKGWDQATYAADYELKTNETENDWSDLIRLLDALNNTPAPQLTDSLGKYLNFPAWYDYWAAHNLFVNLDSYVGSGHNYFIYHNTDSGKFEWITWDVNEAFANFQMNISLANLKILPFTHIPQPFSSRPLMNRMLQNPVMKQTLADHYCALLQDFSNAELDARIDSLAALVRPHVYADTLKFFSNQQFEKNLSEDLPGGGPGAPGVNGIAGLKPFIGARRASLLQQLAGFGCLLTDVSEQPSGAPPLNIFPNPAGDRVRVQTNGHLIERIRLYSPEGRLLRHWNAPAQDFEIETAGLPAGVYWLKTEAEEGSNVFKIVKM